MNQGLERLFLIVGAILVLPFVIQHGLFNSDRTSPGEQVPQLRSIPTTQPAIATAVTPASDRIDQSASDKRRVTHTTGTDPVHSSGISTWSALNATWGEPQNFVGRADAYLFIPSLNVEVPVYTRGGEAALNLGATTIPGTDLNGNGNIGMVSRGDAHFRHLEKVTAGDLLLLKTASSLRQYQVVGTHTVESSDTWIPELSVHPGLTLVTCYPDDHRGNPPLRHIVSAQEVQLDTTGHRRAANDLAAEGRRNLRF